MLVCTELRGGELLFEFEWRCALEGSGRGPESWLWLGVESVRRGGAAVARVEKCSCTPALDMEKSMLGNGLPEDGVRIGVVEAARDGGGKEVNWNCRSCWD